MQLIVRVPLVLILLKPLAARASSCRRSCPGMTLACFRAACPEPRQFRLS